MEKQKAIQILKRQHKQIAKLQGETHDSPKFNRWVRDTAVAIRQVFGENSGHVAEFMNIKYYHEPSWADAGRDVSYGHVFYNGLKDASNLLESMIDEIRDYWPNEEPAPKEKSEKSTAPASNVFIVHGHDEGAKHSVAELIKKLELKPIILHEQSNKGRTIIEKFEDYSDVEFAVILLTPDECCGPADKRDKLLSDGLLKDRARQNVIFELGFFIGKLGRNRVCALHKGNLEIPSDYRGVLFIPMEGDWQLSLAKEMKAAGIKVDLNKIIS